jgi:4-carboxymuconolactone decarboxylase
MSRFPELKQEELTEEQREIYDAIVASRGSTAGPFRIWLHSPELAARTQRVGEYVRYQTVLGARLSELTILVAARHWDCQVEWSIHEAFAVKGGLGQEVIDAMRERRPPAFRNEDERAVYDFCTELLRDRFVPDATFQAALDRLGKQGIVEMTVLLGYYALVAMTLNAFQVALPEGVDAALTDCPTFR